MPQFVKKPIEIEARPLQAPIDFYHEREYRTEARAVADWCGGQLVEIGWDIAGGMVALAIDIRTLEGVMRALPGDYIIRGVAGEFYPCKREIFDASYDRVPTAVRTRT